MYAAFDIKIIQIPKVPQGWAMHSYSPRVSTDIEYPITSSYKTELLWENVSITLLEKRRPQRWTERKWRDMANRLNDCVQKQMFT